MFQYNYRLADKQDIPALMELISTHAIKDADKIVILPEKFRAGSLESSINKQRLFIAQHKSQIIGYKKLFLAQSDELQDILQNELRCVGKDALCAYSGKITVENSFEENQYPNSVDLTTSIYNRADFTLPDYRGHGINSALTNNALKHVLPEVKDAKLITMLYGLTAANAGKIVGGDGDRTVSISKSFKTFINTLRNSQEQITLEHARYKAFMPKFDLTSDILQPLPDNQSVAGFGCILSYKSENQHA